METINHPLTNVQLELLKSFSHDHPENKLNDLKVLLADFFSDMAITEANKVWERDNWDENKVRELLETKLISQ